MNFIAVECIASYCVTVLSLPAVIGVLLSRLSSLNVHYLYLHIFTFAIIGQGVDRTNHTGCQFDINIQLSLFIMSTTVYVNL